MALFGLRAVRVLRPPPRSSIAQPPYRTVASGPPPTCGVWFHASNLDLKPATKPSEEMYADWQLQERERSRGLTCRTLLSTCYQLRRKCVTGGEVMYSLETSVCVIAEHDERLPGGGFYLRDTRAYG